MKKNLLLSLIFMTFGAGSINGISNEDILGVVDIRMVNPPNERNKNLNNLILDTLLIGYLLVQKESHNDTLKYFNDLIAFYNKYKMLTNLNLSKIDSASEMHNVRATLLHTLDNNCDEIGKAGALQVSSTIDNFKEYSGVSRFFSGFIKSRLCATCKASWTKGVITTVAGKAGPARTHPWVKRAVCGLTKN